MQESVLSLDSLNLADRVSSYEAEVDDEWDTEPEAEGK